MGTESHPRPPKKDDDVAALLFGPFELDLRSGELKKAGAPLRLQPQPFKVLALLTSRAGELVTREEIQAEVWPAGTFVDFEQSLNFCIRQIRSVLGDSALTPHYIETLPRRGYRWIGGPVEKVSAVLEFRRPAAVARLAALPDDYTPAAESRPVEPPRAAHVPWAIGAAVLGALALGGFLAWRSPTPERVPSFHRLTYRRGSVDSARFAPDGQVVYSAAWEGEPLAFFTSRMETRESRRVEVPGSKVVGVSRQGEVAFLKGSLLARAPLAGGPPKEVLAGVYQADWSADGSEFVVVRQGPGPTTHVEFPIGTVLCEAVRATHVRLSPDGSQVAFLDHPLWNDDRGSVNVVDRKGHKRMLSDGWASVEGLAWSARGDEVWFTGTRMGADSALHAVSLDGRQRTVLPSMGRLILHDVSRDGRVLLVRTALRNEIRFRRLDEPEERDLSWLDLTSAEDLSADGRTLLFSETGEGGGPDYTIFLRQTDGALPVRLGSGRAMGLSPDGKWVLSVPLKDRSRIDLLPTGAGETRTLRDPAIREYDMAGWLPVGHTIYFAGTDAKGKHRTYLQDIDGGAPRPFLPEGYFIPRSTFTPDGRFLALACKPTEEGDYPGLCLFPVEGGEPRPIAGVPKGAWPTAFDEAGRLYLRESQKGLVAKLSRLDLKTGRLEPWREISAVDRAGATGIQRVLIAQNGQAYAYWYGRNLADLYVVDDAR
jgi:DNA-binding winged helix-turn-helix (wHTH) protein/Tol biopolymer transport system component